MVSQDEQTAIREVTITNAHGLHLRPVMKFVDVASRYVAEIRVDKGAGTTPADGKSPMALMVLEAPKGTVLRILATGTDAVQTVEALAALIQTKFDEE